MSCGACHDGITWATGGGSTLADNQAATYPTSPLATTGHVGRGQADDSQCHLCHTPEFVAYDHRLENITKNNPGVLPTLASFKYEIYSAAVNSTTNDLTIVFRVLKGVSPTPPAGQFLSAPADADYAPVTFVAPAPSVSNPLAGFSGGPSFLLAYATSQDGITAPSDFNNSGIKQQQPHQRVDRPTARVPATRPRSARCPVLTPAATTPRRSSAADQGVPGGRQDAHGGAAGLLHAAQRADRQPGRYGQRRTPRDLGPQDRDR